MSPNHKQSFSYRVFIKFYVLFLLRMASQRLATLTHCSGVTYLPREMHRSIRAGDFPVSLFVISLISVCLFICLSLLPLFILSYSLLLASFCSVIDSCGALRRLSKRIEPRYILLHLMWQPHLCQFSLSYPCYFVYDLLFFFLLSIYPRCPCQSLLFFNPFMMYLVNCNWVWNPVAVVQYIFTHKQYTEQHNVTEYTERNIHNDKNT